MSYGRRKLKLLGTNHWYPYTRLLVQCAALVLRPTCCEIYNMELLDICHSVDIGEKAKAVARSAENLSA